MAKDPAFLFYPNDWIGGTMGMTFEEKGAYMEVLMMQFNRGHMTTDMIGHAVGQLWDKIKDKFIIDADGKYYNARLDVEKTKRMEFTNSRRNNVLGKNQYTGKDQIEKGHMTKHMIGHMENVNENENVIINDIKNEKSITGIVTTTREKNVELYPTFDDFWNQWPEKVAKQNAQKSWSKLSQKEKERVMMHIEPFIQAKHISGQHLPHAATYLNQKRFNDEMLPQATKAPIVQADGRMKIDDIAAILKQKAIDKHQNQINHEPTSLSADNARS